MKRALLIAALILAATAASAQTRAWNFRVLLDDSEIGRHRFTLRENGADRELRSQARFEVKFLAITVYHYEHDATELWRDGCLRALDARTDDDGERNAVQWREPGSGCEMSFAYWNPKILQERRLLNAQTGEIVPVTVQALGEESIAVRGRSVRAKRYRLSAPQLEIDIWLDDGDWVALESPAKGGRLRYELL
jgi:Domain of unknown function (DUF6134)